MLGWLIRSLMRTDVDIKLLLQNLGSFHKNVGVNITHFNPMLESVHESFSYYFPSDYRLQVKYLYKLYVSHKICSSRLCT